MNRVIVILLLCSVCEGYAQAQPDWDQLTFTPYPISEEILPLAEGAADENLANSSQTKDVASVQQWIDAIEERTEVILEQEARYGSLSRELIEPMAALATFYEGYGEYDLANAVLERVTHIIRVNDGLYSLNQASSVQRIIDNHIARGDREEADRQRDYLLTLAERNLDDVRSTPILVDAADSQFDKAKHAVEEGLAPQVVINNNDSPDVMTRTVNSQGKLTYFIIPTSLERARHYYRQAMDTMVRNGVFDLEDVLELEDRLLRTYYFESQEVGQETARRDRRTWLSFQSELFDLGRDVLARKQQYRSNVRASREPAAEELVEIGDWHLLFGRNRQALEHYRSARDSLIDQGAAIEVVDGIFSPNVPAILPLVESRMSSPVRSPHGYIDVTVELNRYGRATEVEVIDGSAEVSKLVEQRLRRHILATQFRPRFIDGKLARSDRVGLRYYFSYSCA